jgi:hypothetical protein
MTNPNKTADTTLSKSKSKGTVKNVVKRQLMIERYDAVLDNKMDNKPLERTRIMSKHHQAITNTEVKRNLGYFDDKKYCVDGINCYPLGYYRIIPRN